MSTSLLNELDGGVCNGLSYAEMPGLKRDSAAEFLFCDEETATVLTQTRFHDRYPQPAQM